MLGNDLPARRAGDGSIETILVEAPPGEALSIPRPVYVRICKCPVKARE
jgi:hypothetical protein